MPYRRLVNCAYRTFLQPLLIVALFGLIPHVSHAVDFLVNQDGSRAEQNHPRVAVAADGSFVVVWADKRSGINEIYLQKFDASRNLVGFNQIVNDDTGFTFHSEPAISNDFSGLFSIVWQDYRNGSYPFDPDIYFQRFDTSVTPLLSNRNMTIERPDSLKESPDISLSPWGGGVVVWADYRNRNWDIYGQLISSNGTSINSNFKINSDVGIAQQHNPRVDVSPDGWFAVTWYDNRWGNDDIFVQRFDSLANPIGINLKVNSDGNGDRQAFPDVACDGAGYFTVVWVDWRNGTYPSNPDIYSRKFDTMLVPVTGDKRINTDGSIRAQREPTISADRRGNVAIIWSDSASNSWDIVGQMIDVEGNVREANFQANIDADSAQLQPDVALDGRNRYIVWTDKRNGNFDIYGSVASYNNPMLIPTPSILKFQMLVGDPIPGNQILVVDHAGYNPLNFDVITSHSWFAVSPLSSQTPDSLTISITDGTLPFGTYLGNITLIDLNNNDSSVVVSVRFDVTAPVLTLSTDTLRFRAFAGIIDSLQADLTVSNSGGGSLNWSITENDTWLSLSQLSGSGDNTIKVTATAENLLSGNYEALLLVDGGSAMNSPDSTIVIIEVVDNLPYLQVQPDSIRLTTIDPSLHNLNLLITNAGIGILNWNATVHDPWLLIDNNSGFSGETINLTIDTIGLPSGQHSTWIDITDSASFNITQRVPFIFDYLLPSQDTLMVGSAQLTSGQIGSMPIDIMTQNSLSGMHLPLTYEPTMVRFDSVKVRSQLGSQAIATIQSDSLAKIFTIDITSMNTDSIVNLGATTILDLYLTALDSSGMMFINESSLNGSKPYLIASDNSRLQTVLLGGDVMVDASTGIDDETTITLPTRFQLSQNYPNPFNMSTNIEFSLPERSKVILEVFNILGQKISTLVDESLPAGEHLVAFDGSISSHELPSGIYFYRLRTDDLSLVRKMMLIK